MIAYSKMRISGTKSKSRSTDLSDFLVFPEEPNSGNASNLKPEVPAASHMMGTTTLDIPNNIKNSSHGEEDSSCLSEQEHDDDEGNKRVLRRCSSTTASNRFFRFEVQQKNMGIESAVRRAFSMRRSSSVSERYCRIHDQSVTLTSEMDLDEDVESERTPTDECSTKSGKKKQQQQHKGGKILRACRRFLRL